MEQEIMKFMNEITYGVPNEKNENLLDLIDEDEVFWKYYHLQTPEELEKSKMGTCWDQVELERYYFEKGNQKINTYFICTYDDENIPSHTFLTFEKNNKHYWFEHSWQEEKGIHEYNTEKELILSVKEKFIKSHKKDTSEFAYTFVYKYDKPKEHITCDEFYEYIETCEIIKLNEPLYFYHLVDKEADISKGLLSLQYMYDNRMYDLFDKYVEKYKYRIVSLWNIEKYKDRKEDTLTREEIIDALKMFRGEYGSSYIYFFKYPPYKELGTKMKEILEIKDIYRININNEKIQKNINDIFYGFNLSNSDNEELSKSYYENVTKEEYFKKYDDTLEMNYSTLNHISISFKNDYCPLEFLEKVIPDE